MSLTIEQLKFAREIGATWRRDFTDSWFKEVDGQCYSRCRISSEWQRATEDGHPSEWEEAYKIDFTPLDDYYADKAVDIAATSVPDGYYHDDEEDKLKPLKPANHGNEDKLEVPNYMTIQASNVQMRLVQAVMDYRETFGLDSAHDPELVEAEKLLKPKRNKYSREIKPGVFVDVYDVIAAWKISNPAQQHLAKKALQAGDRGHKSFVEDMRDIIASAERAIELFNNNERSAEVNK